LLGGECCFVIVGGFLDQDGHPFW